MVTLIIAHSLPGAAVFGGPLVPTWLGRLLTDVHTIVTVPVAYWPPSTKALAASLVFGLIVACCGAFIALCIKHAPWQNGRARLGGVIDEPTALVPVGTFPHGLRQHLDQTVASSFDVTSGDLQPLLDNVFAPYEQRRRTFLEWIRRVDRETEFLAAKYETSTNAMRHIKQRRDLIKEMRQMALEAGELQNIEFSRHLTRFRAYNEHLELELQRERLVGGIQADRALRDQWLKSEQLEQSVKHRHLIEQAKPPARRSSPRTQASKHRRNVEARASAEQELRASLFQRIREILADNSFASVEKAAYIRAIVQAYGEDLENLPREVLEFLKKVEAENHV